MGKKVRLSVRLSLETPEDVAFLSSLSTVPPGRRNRWLRMMALVGLLIPENGSPVPEPFGKGRILRVDLYCDTPEERDLIARARRDFYPGQTLRACLLRGGKTGIPSPGSPDLSGRQEKDRSLSGSPLSPGESVKERLKGLL